MTWTTFITSVSAVFIIAMLVIAVMLNGCSAKDNDIKTSQCSAKIEFNCDCQKDSSIITNILDGANEITE